MREAYFSVGEEVLLVSEDFPELNGETVVLEVIEPDDDRDTWGYELAVDADYSDSYWYEIALRKKHYPSSFTFEQLIKQEVPVDG